MFSLAGFHGVIRVMGCPYRRSAAVFFRTGGPIIILCVKSVLLYRGFLRASYLHLDVLVGPAR